jgi:formylglycine-generating enzyme required for sulfatase activity
MGMVGLVWEWFTDKTRTKHGQKTDGHVSRPTPPSGTSNASQYQLALDQGRPPTPYGKRRATHDTTRALLRSLPPDLIEPLQRHYGA